GREPTTVIRLVSDLTCATTFVVKGLKIVPELEFHNRSFESAVERLVPGLGYEIDRGETITAGRPRTMLLLSLDPRVSDADRIYGAFSIATDKARQRIDRFISSARL